MINNGPGEQLPSMLREVNGRHDTTMKRIITVKEYSEKLGLFAPKEFSNDEHYWFTVMNRNNVIASHLRNVIKDKEELKTVSLSISMNEAEEFMKLEKQRATDGHTKAWSRIALDNFLENLRVKPRRENKTGILLLDIDHFKKYNDTNGHPLADEVLKKLVSILKDNTRASDMVGRYGGEEFMTILTNLPTDTSSEIIDAKAETLREIIEKNLGITVSIGTTISGDSDQSIADIYKRVDRNLYRAKNSGRNLVCSDNGLIAKKG